MRQVKKILEIPQDHPILQAIKLNHLVAQLTHEKFVPDVENIIAHYNEQYPKERDIYLHDFSDDFFTQLDDIHGAKYFRVIELTEPLTLEKAFTYRGVYVQTIDRKMVDGYSEQDFEFPHKYNDPILDAPVPAFCFETDSREYILSAKAHLIYDSQVNLYKLQDLLTGEYVLFRLGYYQDVLPQWFDQNLAKKY